MMPKCGHCPIKDGYCRGLDVRRLCQLSETDPRYTQVVIDRTAQHGPSARPAAIYPPYIAMAKNAIKAAGRVASAVVRGEPIKVTPAVYYERLALCRGCVFHDLARGACTKCGCGGLKLELATEECPLPGPEKKWRRVEGPAPEEKVAP